MKQARHKGLCIVYFYLYKMSRKANLQNLKENWCLPGMANGIVSASGHKETFGMINCSVIGLDYSTDL